jgi:hypothetical protein
MAERKVLNKYYPPDFDPSKIRGFEKKSVRRMCNVRMMLPMTIRCYTCGNYLYIGTKFNMKVETVQEEDYLGIKVYRFYLKCTQCYSEITFKTDPRNHDYVAELGASRNHNPWKDMLMAEEEFKDLKKNEMKEDAMKSLEHRTFDSKREMDILDALDQMKSLNRRQADVNIDELIGKAITDEKEKEIAVTEDEQRAIRDKFSKIHRIEDYDNEEDARIGNIIVKKADKDIGICSTTTFLGKKIHRGEKSESSSDEEAEKQKPTLMNTSLVTPLFSKNGGAIKLKIKPISGNAGKDGSFKKPI